jgi:ABC-type multidrug transport system fused ATPase/permease subunit
MKASVVMPQFLSQWQHQEQKAREANESNLELWEDQTRQTSLTASIDGVNSMEPDQLLQRIKQPPKKHKPSLFIALARSFGWVIFAAGVFKFFQDLLIFASPQLLKLMINFTEDNSLPSHQGYIYALLLFISAEVQSLLLHQYFHRCNKAGLNLRTALIGAIYRKALRLSSSARKLSTVGEIVNLMSVDAQRFMDVMLYLHMVWSAPLQILLAAFFLWQTMGASVMAGVGVMIILFPINGILATILSKLQNKQMELKDQRIKMINEVLSGIKVVKLYAWEQSFLDSISEIRKQELRQLRHIAYISAVMTFTYSCAPFMVSVATFATYSLTGHDLTPEKAFVGISLFNILSFPLAMLPMLVSFLVEVRVSLKRISSFLQKDELDSNSVIRVVAVALDSNDSEAALMVSNGGFKWAENERPILRNINIQVQRHHLLAVVGQVGAGKSSLLSALLGEMHKDSGQVRVQGSVAYVNQQAWIRNATLKDNILFNKAINERHYRRVVKACALKPDFDILPGRDLTEIGEKGINLSGGQKQRVSMARAVYSDADIYLLDDPLSAVDAHVGEHIFNQVIGPNGLLKNKVRILVTHGLAFLPQCDQIIVMTDGQISEVGTYSELIEQNGAFAEYLRTHSNQDKNEQDTNDDHSPTKPGQLEKQESRILDRQLSSVTEDKLENKDKATLIEEEVAMTGRVKFGVILDYAKAAGITISVLLLASFALVNGFAIASNVWLSQWSDDVHNKKASHPLSFYLGIYATFGVLQSTSTMLGTVFLYVGGVRASKTLHRQMLKTVLRAPMSFFDMTPLGRIINRFSKDMYMIDESIPESLFWCIFCFFIILSIVVVISYTTPVFLSVVIPIALFYFLSQRYYVTTSRQVMRLESISRSPIFSHFQETLAGTSTIRAYQQQDLFIDENERRVDSNQLAYYPYMAGNRWLAVRLEFAGNCVVLFAALFAVIERHHLSGGLVGLSLSYALQSTENLTWFVRMTSDFESKIVSVERVKEYAEMPTEAPAVIDSSRPPPGWPSEGQILFNSYSVRYRPELDLVLKRINCSIAAGEKIGIVGRTGAGKSSLTLGLFRVLEAAEGSITLDNVDLATIGLEDLRSHITIIPQVCTEFP